MAALLATQGTRSFGIDLGTSWSVCGFVSQSFEIKTQLSCFASDNWAPPLGLGQIILVAQRPVVVAHNRTAIMAAAGARYGSGG